MNGYDVVVVGGRVAGAATAMLLARAGLRVAVVERGRYGSDTLSTHGLMRAGVLQLSRWGVLGAIVDAGTPAVRRTEFHYRGLPSVQVSIRPSGGVDALYAPRRALLDRALVDAAAEAGAHVFHDTAVTGLLRDGNGRVRGVRAVRGDRGPGAPGAPSAQGSAHGSPSAHGAPVQLRGALTIGADGVRSLVARQAGASVVRQGRSSSAVLYRYVTGLAAVGYEWAYGPGCAAGLVPTNDGRTCVFVSTRPERMRSLRRRGTEHAFRTLLAEASPGFAERVGAAQPDGHVHGWAGMPGVVRRPWGSGWALVGDAGYYKDPITAHGITDALRDAELLADQVVELLGGGTPAALALGRYQVTRDRLSGRLYDATEEIAAYDWDMEQVQHLMRRVSSAMTDEVDHLQTRPVRRVGPAFAGDIPADMTTPAT